ncbi:MAG TPA: arylsulfotransferase family protein [Acidimicrobiales bacterium]|nr:arylsulfotransferase family protein [Acidimicrobiales bacterium]
MPTDPNAVPGLSRRRFLGTSLKAGAAGLVAGAAGGPLAALAGGRADAAPEPIKPLFGRTPASPPNYRRFITRPDLRPPGVTVETTSGFPYSSTQPGYIFVAPRVAPGGTLPPGMQPGLLILDLRGDTVWFQPQTGTGKDPFSFGVQSYQNNSVLAWFEGTVGDGFAVSGEYVLADTSYKEIARFSASGYPSDLHEVRLASHGTALVTAYQTGVKEGSSTLIVGHAQEIDIATNSSVWDWPCYPHVPTSASYTGTSGDYFHINSLDVWPGDDEPGHRKILISSRNTGAVYLVDQITNRILWRVGGKSSKVPSFRLGRGVPFAYQHDARALADGSGFSLFDDASAPSPEPYSSGKVITLDQRNMTATLRHQYFHTDGQLKVGSQGNCQLLPNGGHVVGWGAARSFSEFRASGNAMNAEMILDGLFPPGVESYRAYMFDWHADPPQSELRLVVKPSGGTGHFTGWVSWNGATRVAAWRMNAGPSSHSMEVITTVAKRSFETAINFTRVGAKAFRVAALDSSGRVITRTSVVGAT